MRVFLAARYHLDRMSSMEKEIIKMITWIIIIACMPAHNDVTLHTNYIGKDSFSIAYKPDRHSVFKSDQMTASCENTNTPSFPPRKPILLQMTFVSVSILGP